MEGNLTDKEIDILKIKLDELTEKIIEIFSMLPI